MYTRISSFLNSPHIPLSRSSWNPELNSPGWAPQAGLPRAGLSWAGLPRAGLPGLGCPGLGCPGLGCPGLGSPGRAAPGCHASLLPATIPHTAVRVPVLLSHFIRLISSITHQISRSISYLVFSSALLFYRYLSQNFSKCSRPFISVHLI